MAACILLLLSAILHIAHGLVDYVVYPTNKRDVTASSQIDDALVKLLGNGKVQSYESHIRQTTEFWVIQALEYQKSSVLRIPGVDAVVENVVVAQNTEEGSTSTSTIVDSPRFNKASRQLKLPIRRQRDGPQDLDLVSWPPRKRLPIFGKMQWYVYDAARGVDTYIYVIDNGINSNNAEFQRMPWPPKPSDWHYALDVSQKPTDDNLAGHGSCVASKAAGWTTGVSKNSQLVIIKSLPTVADVNFAFAAALDDIISKQRQGKAVVVYPATSTQTFKPQSALPRNWKAIQELIQELFDHKAVVVTGAGNDAARTATLDTVPAMWGLDEDFPLIVAGAVKTDGTPAKFSQGASNQAQIVWAPGENVVCAMGPSLDGLATRSGTSFAAAMVAGLAAYQLNTLNPAPSDSVAALMRSKLLANSRPISPRTNPNVIWNGQSAALGDNSTVAQAGVQLVSTNATGAAVA